MKKKCTLVLISVLTVACIVFAYLLFFYNPSNQIISTVILLRGNGNRILFAISFVYNLHRLSLMKLIVSRNILENMDVLIIDLYNLIPCLKPCLSCRRSCIYRSYDRFVYTDKADNNECTNKGKNKVKYRTCGNDRDPAPRRFAVEASL